MRIAGAEQADLVMTLTEGDNRNALSAQVAKHTFGVPRVIAKINDPLRGEAYRALGLETICRTIILGDALVMAAQNGAEATNGFVEPATAEPRRLRPRPGRGGGRASRWRRRMYRRRDRHPAGRRPTGRAVAVYVVVVGGGNVGYYLTKELLAAGHEVVVIEEEVGRARQIADELGSIVVANDGCEGRYQAEAGMGRADVMAAVTGDDAVNLAACQIAKMRFNVPRSIARINDPKNEKLFRQLAIDETVSPTRSILGVIEHEIPIHDLLHLAELEGGEVQIVEAQLDADSPVIGRELRELDLPEGSSIAVLIRDERAQSPRSDTKLRSGDKLLAVTSAEREAELRSLLIGE